jgi:hypothetical protein
MKKLLLSIMALAALNYAEAKKVKFQVDMTGKTISPNGVHVAGSFQGWNPSATALSNGGSGNIYSAVVDIPAGTYYEFKFINDNNWGAGEEAIPAISQVGSVANGGSNSNRWLYIDSIANDTTIFPAVMFAGSAPAGMFAIRFAVDMKNETVGANGVHIAGNIQTPNWVPAANNMANLISSPVNKVYEYIAYLAAGSYAYKYVNGNDWNAPSVPENNIPAACAPGGDRALTVSADEALAKVCFNSCTACPGAPIPTYRLSFIVDMSNSDCDGGYDSVTVTGAGARLTNFGAGLKMAEIGSTKMFAIVVDSLDSGEVKFKFRKHKNGNTGWEDGSDRIFTLSKADTIDLTCFGSRVVGNCVSKPASSTITFIVDLRDTVPGVPYVMGTFQTPNWQTGALRMNPKPGMPGVFEITVNNVCPGSFNYKFLNFTGSGVDSMDAKWEEPFNVDTLRSCAESNGQGGWNRKYTRLNANPVTLAFKFNSCVPSDFTGINDITLTQSFKLFPNPAQSYTMIEFNDNTNLHNVVVMDITGKTIQSFTDYKQNSLLINTDEMSKGIYFIKASNTRNESVTSKLIVR